MNHARLFKGRKAAMRVFSCRKHPHCSFSPLNVRISCCYRSLTRGGNRRGIRGWEWLNLGEVTFSKLLDLFQHLEALRQRLGADIAHRLQQFAKTFSAGEECVDNQERPHIAEQA